MRDILYTWVLYELVAIPLTLLWSYWLHKVLARHATRNDTKADRIWWIPLLIGIFERGITSLLIGWQVSGAAGFIGTWIIGKSGGGWSGWGNKSKYDRGLFFVGLLGSALSLFVGICMGLAILKARRII